MPVGTFPGVTSFNRRTIKAPDNPLDKSTIVSIYPKEIDETKPTIQPGRFVIPPGNYEKPALLVVGPSSWWKELEDNSPLLEIPQGSIQIANSIIVDYCNGILGCDMAGAMPGIFYIPGAIGLTELISKHKNMLDTAREKQKKWFMILVQMADTLWSRSNGNPLAISDDMRLGARELGLNTKEWLADFQNMETVRCVACGFMRNPMFPMCSNCKTVIDTKKFAELGLKVAG